MATAGSSTDRIHLICLSRSPQALEIVRTLLGRGENPKERGSEGLTPLHAAAAVDNVAICQLLLHFGADVSAKDDHGRTPHHVATGSSKTFLTRYIEKDRRTRRGILRRLFMCQAGIYSPEPKPSSFVKDLQNRFRRSVGIFKRKSVIEATAAPEPLTPKPTPRRRARTPDGLRTEIRAVPRTPKRSKTPDFEPGRERNPTPKAAPAVAPKSTAIRITPRSQKPRLPPRQMNTPTAPPITPVVAKKATPRVTIAATTPKTSKNAVKKSANTSTDRDYVTAEESFNTLELERRLSQLQIKVPEPSFVDESKLRRIRRLKDSELRVELRRLGIAAGPICSRTRRLYEKKLLAAEVGHSAVVKDAVKFSRQLEMAFTCKVDTKLGEKLDHSVKSDFHSSGVTAFVYILIDPRILGDDTKPALKQFVEAIFYIGKGTKARPLAHLIDAKRLRQEKSLKITTSDKFKRINSIWESGHGVGLLELSHTISDGEAFTREAAFIEAIRLENLSNIKGGEWHGSSRQWDAPTRANYGCYLLEQARVILHTMSIRRVFPEDLPDSVYPFVTPRRR